MRRQEGAAGYGIYVMLLELVRDSEDQQVFDDPESLAFAIHEDDVSMISRICHDYSLFTLTDDGYLRSPFLAMCQQQADERAAKAREWGLKGAKARYGHSSAQQSTPQTTQDPQEPGQLSTTLHGNMPYRVPIGGGIPDPCINQNNNNNNDIKEKEDQPTKSKLVSIEWLGISGKDWLELCSSSPMLDKYYMEVLLAEPSKPGHNPILLVDWINTFGLPRALFEKLEEVTDYWTVKSPAFQAIFAVVKHVRDTKYRPAHPAQYLIYTAIKFYNQV